MLYIQRDSPPGHDRRALLLNSLHLAHDHARLLPFPVDVKDFGHEACRSYCGIKNVIEVDCETAFRQLD